MDFLFLALCAVAFVGICAAGAVGLFVLHSPFRYPYCEIMPDISGKRSPDKYDLLDTYLIDNGPGQFSSHFDYVQQWKRECLARIDRSLLKGWRQRQYDRVVDDNHMFRFVLTRSHKRYRQVNYRRTAYTVDDVVADFSMDFDGIRKRYAQLSAIDFECPLSQYNAKDQRRLVTKELREQIAKRDNYTCRICGKYMPDGVGLQIDHIVPIKKGGKSVPSNLQVLCSKCNAKKSDKLIY